MVYKIYWRNTKLCKLDRDSKKEFCLQNDLYHLKLEEKTF